MVYTLTLSPLHWQKIFFPDTKCQTTFAFQGAYFSTVIKMIIHITLKYVKDKDSPRVLMTLINTCSRGLASVTYLDKKDFFFFPN